MRLACIESINRIKIYYSLAVPLFDIIECGRCSPILPIYHSVDEPLNI